MNKISKKIVALSSAVAPFLAAPVAALAQAQTLTLPTGSQYGFNRLDQAIGSVMNLVFFFALLLVLVYLVWGGIQWITSGGDKQGTEAARGKITGAIVGIIIVAVAFAIYNIILTFIGASNGITISRP